MVHSRVTGQKAHNNRKEGARSFHMGRMRFVLSPAIWMLRNCLQRARARLLFGYRLAEEHGGNPFSS
jgi:hypothetical protein